MRTAVSCRQPSCIKFERSLIYTAARLRRSRAAEALAKAQALPPSFKLGWSKSEGARFTEGGLAPPI
jgi:hypothetical protein